MKDETRLRGLIRNAAPNDGRQFPHWFGNGWFVLVRKTHVQLWHSCEYDARRAKEIDRGPRDGATYANFSAAMGW